MPVSDEYPEVTLLLRHWSNGGSALPAVNKLAESGYPDDAATRRNGEKGTTRSSRAR